MIRISVCLLSVLLLSNVLYAASWEAPEVLEGATPVTAEELSDLIKGMDNLVLIDTRRELDFKSGTIAGSVSLPTSRPSPSALANVVPDKTTPVVFYCDGVSCSQSIKAVKKAASYGYVNIFWFRGGMDEWVQKGFPVTHDTN